MAAYKDEARGIWYVSFYDNDWTGKKETVYMLVQTIEKMQADIHKMYDEIIETGQIKEKNHRLLVKFIQILKNCSMIILL